MNDGISIAKEKRQENDLIIFVLDDSSLMRLVLEDNINKALPPGVHAKIFTFESPELMTKELSSFQPDIIVTDNDFGSLSKLGAVDVISQLPQPYIKKYICSNLPIADLKLLATATKADGYFSPESSHTTISNIICFEKSKVNDSSQEGSINTANEEFGNAPNEKFSITGLSGLFHNLMAPANNIVTLAVMLQKLIETGDSEKVNKVIEVGIVSIKKSIHTGYKSLDGISTSHLDPVYREKISEISSRFVPQLSKVEELIQDQVMWLSLENVSIIFKDFSEILKENHSFQKCFK